MLNVSPDIQPVGDILFAEDFAELQVAIEANIPVAGAEHDLHVPKIGVIGAGHKVDGVIVVHVVIVITMHEGLNIKSTAEAEEVAHHIRVTEGKVAGAEAAEADAAGCYPSGAGVVTNLGNELFSQEFIILNVAFDPVLGVDFGVPACIIDAVWAKHLYEPSFYEPTDALNHATVLCLEITTQGSRENDEGIAVGAEGEHFYGVAKVMTKKFG